MANLSAIIAPTNVVTTTGTQTLSNKTLTAPALGTPASGIVTNLTGTASININGTVGATTATTGAFTSLSATGVTTLQAGTAALPALTTSGDTNTGIFFPAADTIAFSEGGTESMRIDSSGNLLVGTTTASGKFTGEIGGDVFTSGTASAFLNFKASTGRPCIQVQSVGVGQDAAFRNAVYDGTNSIYFTIGQNIASSAGNLDFMYGTVAGTQTTTSGTVAVRFTSAGQIYNITGTYGTISDAKLKENITDATPKLADLMRLQVRNFNLKADATKAKQLGFIAQEIQQVFPACVEMFDDIDQETKEKTGETLTVKTAILIPMLVKAMQEQQAIIESLKARLDAANL